MGLINLFSSQFSNNLICPSDLGRFSSVLTTSSLHVYLLVVLVLEVRGNV